jgi:hypothetical protein
MLHFCSAQIDSHDYPQLIPKFCGQKFPSLSRQFRRTLAGCGREKSAGLEIVLHALFWNCDDAVMRVD